MFTGKRSAVFSELQDSCSHMTYMISTEHRLRCEKTGQLVYRYKHLDAMSMIVPQLQR